jgi:hypothetical protein
MLNNFRELPAPLFVECRRPHIDSRPCPELAAVETITPDLSSDRDMGNGNAVLIAIYLHVNCPKCGNYTKLQELRRAKVLKAR